MDQSRPAVFVDRDGTIIEHRHYLTSTSELSVLEGAAQAIARLNEAGLAVVLATNQSAVGRGFLSQAELEAIHRDLCRRLQEQDASLDGIYFCPHHPTQARQEYRVDCPCRKPKPGMLKKASRRLALDLARSFMIGDTLSDIQAGHAAGCRSILVETGKGRQEARRIGDGPEAPDFVAADLSAAVDWLLENPS